MKEGHIGVQIQRGISKDGTNATDSSSLGSNAPCVAPSEHRTMERCLNLFHLQGFSVTCFTWLYVFTDSPFLSAWTNGGPPAIIYGCLLAICGTGFVTISLAEVASACPNIGGLYYYSARLAPQAYKGIAGFMTAHCNIVGVVTSLAFVVTQLAGLLANIRYTVTYDPVTGTGQLTSGYQIFYIYAGLMILLGLLASVPSRCVSFYCSFALCLSVITFFSLTITILILAPTHNSSPFVFQSWLDHSADTGVSSRGLSFVLACGFPINVLSGWDTTIYMTEEVLRPTYTVPAAMLRGYTMVVLMGGLSILILLFSIQDSSNLYASSAVFGGTSPVSQMLWDVTQARFGSGSASAVFMVLIAMCLFLMCLFLLIGTSRKLYAMARDRLVAGSDVLSVLDSRMFVPLRALWVIVLILVCLGLALLADDTGVTFSIVTAENLPLTLTSYLLPIVICLRTKEKLLPGPWNTGSWGPLVRSCGAAYVIFTMIVSMLPATYPILKTAPPWAPIMWLSCLVVMQVCWWLPKIGGRHYYSGPVSANIGSVQFAVTSPILVPTSRPTWWASMLSKGSPKRGSSVLSKQPTVDGAVAPNQLVSGSVARRWASSSWVCGWLGPQQCLSPRLLQEGAPEVRQSPNTFYRQPVLRIPGEREAVHRAQRSPVHPSGYAYDREAATRLGHGTRVSTSHKRIILCPVVS